MRGILVIILLSGLFDCSKDSEVTPSVNECVAKLQPSSDPGNFEQCVDACIKCEHGVKTTCSTACRLRGAK